MKNVISMLLVAGSLVFTTQAFAVDIVSINGTLVRLYDNGLGITAAASKDASKFASEVIGKVDPKDLTKVAKGGKVVSRFVPFVGAAVIIAETSYIAYTNKAAIAEFIANPSVVEAKAIAISKYNTTKSTVEEATAIAVSEYNSTKSTVLAFLNKEEKEAQQVATIAAYTSVGF